MYSNEFIEFKCKENVNKEYKKFINKIACFTIKDHCNKISNNCTRIALKRGEFFRKNHLNIKKQFK